MPKETPCDYGECPYDAMYGETCRVYCGLGVDKDEGEEFIMTQLKQQIIDKFS